MLLYIGLEDLKIWGFGDFCWA